MGDSSPEEGGRQPRIFLLPPTAPRHFNLGLAEGNPICMLTTPKSFFYLCEKENSKKREDRFERGENEGDQSEERRTFPLVTPANLSLEKEIERSQSEERKCKNGGGEEFSNFLISSFPREK